MKKLWGKIKRPICGVIVVICLLLLLGCTGTAELGGDMVTYCLQGSVLLAITIVLGLIGGFIE